MMKRFAYHVQAMWPGIGQVHKHLPILFDRNHDKVTFIGIILNCVEKRMENGAEKANSN